MESSRRDLPRGSLAAEIATAVENLFVFYHSTIRVARGSSSRKRETEGRSRLFQDTQVSQSGQMFEGLFLPFAGGDN